MKTQDAVIEKIRLDSPIHFTGLSFADSDLPKTFESLGLLWDRFHQEVLNGLENALQPAVEVAVSVTGKDYIVGSQTLSAQGGPGLAVFTIPAGDYVKGSFSAASFSELVDGKLQTIWDDMYSWAGEQGIAMDESFGAEVYPQDRVNLPRPEMYCLCPIKNNDL